MTSRACVSTTVSILTNPNQRPNNPETNSKQDAVEAVSGRLEITDIVRALLAKTVECCPADLPILMYLLCGKIYPAYKGVELGIGDKILFEALKTGLGASPKTLQQHMGDDGDMGVAAQKCKAAQRTLGFGRAPKPLTCKGK